MNPSGLSRLVGSIVLSSVAMVIGCNSPPPGGDLCANVECDDGDACTNDDCVDGQCVYTNLECNDGDPCTEDACVDGQCVYTDLECDDGDPRTEDACVDGRCVNAWIDGGGDGDDGGGDDASCVSFDLLNGETLPPSVVKLYFQLSTCDGDPLVGIQPGQFRIEEDGTEVSVYESKQGYSPEPRPFELAAVLLLDMSGSILESGNLSPLQQAAKAFVQTVAPDQSVAVYTFDGRAHLQLLADFTADVNALKAVIDSLSGYQVVDESTNLNGAVVRGLDVLDDERDSVDPDALFTGALIVFTDGTDQAARTSDSHAVSAASDSSHSVYTIGLGGEVDRDHLESIGKDGTYIADDVNALEAVFASAASDIEAMAQSYYILAYCSPKRAGDHTLELSLRDATGSVTYGFDAHWFAGGCSPDDFLGDRCPNVACDDGDPCTEDTCVDGQCIYTDVECDDGDPCTEDTCVDGQCIYTDVECEEGKVCVDGVCIDAPPSIVAWGYNESGSGQCNVPAPNTDFVAVAAGSAHSVGLKGNGSIVAWGQNDFGLCDVPAPNTDFVAVAADRVQNLGLKADGSIVAWGLNDFGQSDVPVPNTDFVAVAAGCYHSLGLKGNGSIVAWGGNDQGQCDVPAPNTDFVAVAAGSAHSLGLKADGSIVAWGYNGWGGCDVPVPNMGFVAVAGGWGHSLGLKGGG